MVMSVVEPKWLLLYAPASFCSPYSSYCPGFTSSRNVSWLLCALLVLSLTLRISYICIPAFAWWYSLSSSKCHMMFRITGGEANLSSLERPSLNECNVIRMGAWVDLTLMTLTFVFSVIWNVEVGIVVSLIISLLLVVHRSSRARMTILVSLTIHFCCPDLCPRGRPSLTSCV